MLPSWQRFADRHPRLVEAGFMLLVLTVTSRQYEHGGHGWAAGQPLAVAACAALLRRRRRPALVVVATALCGAVSLGLGYMLSPLLLLPVLVALYELAARAPQRTVYLPYALAVTLVVLAALLDDDRDRSWTDESFGPVFWLLLPVLAGSAVQARRAYLNAVHLRAEHAERTREEEARRRVAEERVRIARELHDVVAHHMALAHAQAGTAARLARSRPAQAEEILGELTGTTSAALRELQATVGLLRQAEDPDGPGGPDAAGAPLEPAPGLGRLPELVAAFASAGLHVAVAVEGPERPLPPGLDLTAYRIVQEALTNVAKHAAARAARVRLAYAHDRLTLTVSDDGGDADADGPKPPGGFGLIGMRERARAAGGSLSAGPRPEGGFAVTAELPLPVRSRPPHTADPKPTAPSGEPR